ncbi:MAG: acetyl-CoA carboxylase biotin carboxylase subunit [Bacteroidota bacterium]|nr:acetyl-CoA carboxylase biotin carboxylase subunit [Bacteroidota bacterium]
MKKFNKILIANRGEIAVRIIKAAKDLGIKTVAVYSLADRNALHVEQADESFYLGSNDLAETYLDIEKIISIAKKSGCEAIHPGYGFLAENPAFVKACDKARIIFIGPSEKAIRLMGNKIESRAFVQKTGIAITEGITGDAKTLSEKALKMNYPILVKAAAGGGGKGMKIVEDHKDLQEILESTSREAASYFGDGTVYIEKYIQQPRHIEVQVLGDNYGNVIHLFERECSLQRRFQKIIEESPSITLNAEVRKALGDAAVRIAREIGYNSAGTVEFLVDHDLNFYFLEMNTRIQVEHPVTEMVTGIDIVREQLLIASGKKMDLPQEDISQNGHAIECRIYAEDPENEFLPSPGCMSLYSEPEGEGIRVDSGINKTARVESFYDPMIAKLIVWGKDREKARVKMIKTLDDFVIHGIKTNISYLKFLLKQKAYKDNKISTGYCDKHSNEIIDLINKEKQRQSSMLPLIASFLFDDLRTRLDHFDHEAVSVWRKIGYWRDVFSLNAEVDREEISISVKQESSNNYFFQIEDKSQNISIKNIDKSGITLSTGEGLQNFFVSRNKKAIYYVSYNGFVYEIKRNEVLPEEENLFGSDAQGPGSDQGNISSPMPGKLIKMNVKKGDKLDKGTTLAIVEAMKMENHIKAPFDSEVLEVKAKEGTMVDGNEILLILEPVEGLEKK